ncbi:MAG TPA: DEAD/DEAH box helicase [Longimicrobium sp.]|nr:DEAD/DEAH box helicase [Longimicrobium sp.]
MIVVHASITPAQLFLWAESSTRGPMADGRKSARKPRPHPFALPAEELKHIIGQLGSMGESAQATDATLHLPSFSRSPEASPQLVRTDVPSPGDHVGTMPWIVPAMALSHAGAVDFLLELPEAVPEGVVAGDTLRALREVAKLAVELVARGRVLPCIEQGATGFHARWKPALTDDDDLARMATLRRCVPLACGAAEGTERATVADPAAVSLEGFVDGCIRQALLGHTLLPARRSHRAPGERWASALLDPAGGSPAPSGDEGARLHAAVAAWQRAVAPAAAHGLRTCFRLSPPAEDAVDAPPAADAPWRLDFLLQAADDPSLMVPADEVWRAKETLKVLRRTVDNPQERLLEDLGRALRIFPPLQPGLKTARPTGCALDAEGAYRFLRDGAPLLAQAGFGVRVPGWWGKRAARLGAKLVTRPSPKSEAEGRFGLDALVAYDWKLSLGDQPVTAAELQALARHKAPLVRFRGQWVEVRPEEMEAALRLFQRGASGEMSAAEALRLAMSGGEDATPEGLEVAGIEAHGWLRDLLAAEDGTAAPVPEPPGFAGTLRPYQSRGVGWLSFLDRLGVGACLADDMGLGKTVQLLALLLAERAEGAGGKRGKKRAKRPPPTLMVCPMSLVGNWQREAARFAPSLVVHVHHGAERLSGDALRQAVSGADLVITTYALAARDREQLAEVEWGRVVLDEAQNVKNAAARQSQAVRSFRAPRRIALTGTPVENRLAELWSIMEFLNPGLLGSASDFRRTFAVPVERYRDAGAAARLQRITRPFVLRRLKTDRTIIADLPEKVEMKVFCNLTREQASLYQAIVDEMMEKVENSEGIERRGLVLSTLLKLKQVCNHPAQLLQDRSAIAGRSGKLARLEELLEEVLAVGDRALVFTQFAEMGHLLRARLEERFAREVPFLHGGTGKAARDELVARFQEPGGPAVLLLSLKAGGTGLNLTAANHVIHYDRWWNPAVENQATDRAFRIGQRRNVQVRKLMCAGTLEERIDAVIEEKTALAGSVLGTGEAWLTEVSTAELRDVVSLASDAVAE